MSDLMELYHQMIIDHGRHPRNIGACDGQTHAKRGYNPLCGDQLTVSLLVSDGVIEDVKFKGDGCAISLASASLMTEAVKGKSVGEAQALFNAFRACIMNDDSGSQVAGSDKPVDLGKLSVLEGVKAYPMRVKCATLAWHTLQSALNNEQDEVTTEK